MPYLVKKVGGFGLVLLGGLTIAHGVVAGQAWEILPGLILMIIGAGSQAEFPGPAPTFGPLASALLPDARS